MHYELVFDAREGAGLLPYLPVFVGAVFVAGIGLMLFMRVRGEKLSLADTIFRYFTLTLPLVAAPSMIILAVQESSSLVGALDDGTATLVQGPVEDFHSGSAKIRERFTVAGTAFCYQGAVINGGFHHTSGEGGPLHAGLEVRIWHVDGRIARLEIGR